jgi:hypothetical protein
MEVSMNKQNFILTELEAIGKDIETVVKEERERLAREEKIEQEIIEQSKKNKIPPVIKARPYGLNKFIPELAYLETRLRAIQSYLAQDQDFKPFQL